MATKHMTIKAVLFNLEGVKDRDHFILPVEAYQWLTNIRPGDHKIPANILEALVPFLNDPDEQEEIRETEIYATVGSPDNDVALHLSSYVKVFPRERDAVALANKNGWELQEYQYDGHIY